MSSWLRLSRDFCGLAVDSRPAFVPGHTYLPPATPELLQLLTSRLWVDRTRGLRLGSGALLSRPLFMPGDRVLLRFLILPGRQRVAIIRSVLVNTTDQVRISEVMFRTND